MSFKRAFFTVGGLTLISRFTGFIRDVMAANILGAGMAADVFFVALRLPNLFRRLFAEGAFAVSFVPLFTGALKEGKEEAKVFAEQAMAGLMLVLIPFSALMILVMPWFMHLITPGFASEPEKFALAVSFSQITFPYLFFISMTALLGSLLNAVGRFAPFAAAPVAFNLCQLIALWIWNDTPTSAAHAQVWAVTVSGVVQWAWLIYAARRAGWSLRFVRPRMTPKIKRLLKLVGPGALSGGVMQINIFIDMILASLLPAGAISYLAYSERLYQLPIGVIGAAIGTALLPMLSATVRSASPEKALGEQNRAIEFGLYLGLPAAVVLVTIPVPILSVLFERGAFTPEVTYYTAWAGAAYALAIPAYMFNKVLTTAYYAREDTKTPFLVSLKTVFINSMLALILILSLRHSSYAPIAHAAIALCTALTTWINGAFLWYGLKKRGHFVADAAFWPRIGGTFASGAAMGVVLLLGYWQFAELFDASFGIRAATLAGLASAGVLTYFALAHLTEVQRLDEAWHFIRRKKPANAPSAPTSDVV